MPRFTGIAVFVLFAAGCSEPAPSSAPAPLPAAQPIAPAPPTPAAVVAPPAAAAAPPPTVFAAPPPGAISATGDAGALAAWSAGRSAAFVQPLGKDGAATGAARELSLTSAHKLHAVYPVGSGFAVAAHDLCPDRKFFHKCLFLRAVSADGAAVGGETTLRTREWIREELVARLDGVTGVLTSHMYIPPAFARLTLGPDGALVVDRRDLPVREEIVDAVKLTAADGKFVALLRSQIEEPARSIRLEIDASGKVTAP